VTDPPVEPHEIRTFKDRLAYSLALPYVLLRYFGSSLVTAITDYVAFGISYAILHDSTVCIFIGRLASILVSYFLLRRVVFETNQAFAATFFKFVLVVTVSGIITSLSVSWLQAQWGLNVLLAKLVSEGGLYFINFFILKRVFARRPLAGLHSS
jgi:putative flippase GtrA